MLRPFHAAGPEVRMRLARRDRARWSRRAGARRRARAVHAEFRAARTNTSGPSRSGVQVTLDNLLPARDVAGGVRRPGDLRAHRYRHRPRPPPPRAHRRRALQVRRAAGRDRRAGASTPRRGVRVVGLHAHSGSGIFDVANWSETGELLAELAARFPDVQRRRSGRRPRRAGARRARPDSIWRAWMRRWRGLQAAHPRCRVLAGARALPGGPGRRVAGARHAAEGQGRACATSASRPA